MTKPVPGDKQSLVAAFLREHPSKVFTDIAPGEDVTTRSGAPSFEARYARTSG